MESRRIVPAPPTHSDRNYRILRTAIERRWNVQAVYAGLPRLLSPHMMGWKRGEPHVFSYQFGGFSHRGLHEEGSPLNFRCMRVALLHWLILIPGRWHTSVERPQDLGNCIDEIDVSVKWLEAA
jgi:hypothetical protein